VSAAQRLVALIPEHSGCSAELLRMQTGWTLQAVEEGLHQAVTQGLAIRKDNRYLRLVVHPAPAPTADPAPTPDEPAPPAEDTPMPKTCIKCEKSLPVPEFGDDSRTEDGKARTCKGCRGKPQKAATAEPARPLKRIADRLEQIGTSPLSVALEQLRAQRAKLDQAIAALEALS
jgi:hypothetical protein